MLLVDLDGTLCNDFHRHHLAPDWERYHKLCRFDIPIRSTVELVWQFGGSSVVIMTGRDDSNREDTERWLERFSIPYRFLFMRPVGNRKSNHNLKKEWIHSLFCVGFRPTHLIDDNPKVHEVAETFGIMTMYPVGAEERNGWFLG